MSPKLLKFCLNILIFLYSITSIDCYCNILLSEDLSKIPTFYKVVGTHKLKTFKKTDQYYLELFENQEIEALCDVQFEPPRTLNQLFIKCLNNQVHTKAFKKDSYELYSYSNQINLECSYKKWDLFESNHNFEWCPFNMISYVLGRFKDRDFDNMAGICYDIYDLSLASVYYTLAPKYSEYTKPSAFENLGLPGVRVTDIEQTFGPNNITTNDFDNKQFQNWITSSNYEFDSIIQHSTLNSTFNRPFSSILEFTWWPNLRRYNWKRYETALEDHIEKSNQTYDILAGVSGALKAPIIENCQANYTMKEVIDNRNRKIPLYVWNYLQPRDNSTNPMIVIGFNSPFHEFYSQEDVVFCPDKCQEIPWLKKVSSSFRFGVMGIVFCCNAEDVRFSKRLHNFPENDLKSNLEAVTTTNFLDHYERNQLEDEDNQNFENEYNEEDARWKY